MLKKLKELRDDESGATAIEYAVILGVVTVVIVGALGNLGISDRAMYNFIANEYVAALGG